jgi:hypothetical protein
MIIVLNSSRRIRSGCHHALVEELSLRFAVPVQSYLSTLLHRPFSQRSPDDEGWTALGYGSMISTRMPITSCSATPRTRIYLVSYSDTSCLMARVETSLWWSPTTSERRGCKDNNRISVKKICVLQVARDGANISPSVRGEGARHLQCFRGPMWT